MGYSSNGNGIVKAMEAGIGDFLSHHPVDVNLYGLPKVHQSHPDLIGIFDRGGDTLFSVSGFSPNGSGNTRDRFMAYVVAPNRVVIPVQDSDEACAVFWDFPDGIRTERDVMLQTALACFRLYHHMGCSIVPSVPFDERLRSDEPLMGDRSREIGRASSYADNPTERYARHIVFSLYANPAEPREIVLGDISFHAGLIGAVETEESSNPDFLLKADGIDTKRGWHPIRPASAPPPTDIESILRESLP